MEHINNFLFKRRRSKYLLRRSIALISMFIHLLFKNTIKHLLTIYGLAFESFPRHNCHKTNSWSKKDLDVTSCQISFLDYPVNSIKQSPVGIFMHFMSFSFHCSIFRLYLLNLHTSLKRGLSPKNHRKTLAHRAVLPS